MTEAEIKSLAWEKGIVAATDDLLFAFVSAVENRLLDQVAAQCCAAISSMMNGAQDAQSGEEKRG